MVASIMIITRLALNASSYHKTVKEMVCYMVINLRTH